MISLTDIAIETVIETMKSDETVTATHLRVAVQGGGCAGYSYALDFDDPDEDDLVLEFGKLSVCIDAHSAALLEGTIIDYVNQPLKSGFVFNNPNATRTCGCGSSWA